MRNAATGSLLTEAVPIAGALAPSRVVFGPHETNLARGRALGDRACAYYAARAAGGAGVVVTEIASVTADDWPYERAPLASSCAPGWAVIAGACRPYGTVVLAGLGVFGAWQIGVVNAIAKPIAALLSLPLIVLTLGLFLLVLNALMLWLTSWIADGLDLPFEVDGFWAAFWGALVISIVTFIVGLFVGDARRD